MLVYQRVLNMCICVQLLANSTLGFPDAGGAGGCWFGGAGNVCCGVDEKFGGGKRLGDGGKIMGKSWENHENIWKIMGKTRKHVGKKLGKIIGKSGQTMTRGEP
jgi:hypothetical protein